MQHCQAGDAPVLIRIESNAGHGAGKPTSKRIAEEADTYSFLFQNIGVPYKELKKTEMIRRGSPVAPRQTPPA